MDRRSALFTLSALIASGGHGLPAQPPLPMPECDHTAWVAGVLQRMLTIKPGMTRSDLLSVFKEEGSLSTAVERTYISRNCAYFKVDVTFKPVGRPDRDAEGRVTPTEDGRDLILTVSRPYLALAIYD